jgi:hypothetical protein
VATVAIFTVFTLAMVEIASHDECAFSLKTNKNHTVIISILHYSFIFLRTRDIYAVCMIAGKWQCVVFASACVLVPGSVRLPSVRLSVCLSPYLHTEHPPQFTIAIKKTNQLQ